MREEKQAIEILALFLAGETPRKARAELCPSLSNMIGSHNSRLERIFLSAIVSFVHIIFFSRSTCLTLVLERLLYDPANENPMFLLCSRYSSQLSTYLCHRYVLSSQEDRFCLHMLRRHQERSQRKDTLVTALLQFSTKSLIGVSLINIIDF